MRPVLFERVIQKLETTEKEYQKILHFDALAFESFEDSCCEFSVHFSLTSFWANEPFGLMAFCLMNQNFKLIAIYFHGSKFCVSYVLLITYQEGPQHITHCNFRTGLVSNQFTLCSCTRVSYSHAKAAFGLICSAISQASSYTHGLTVTVTDCW